MIVNLFLVFKLNILVIYPLMSIRDKERKDKERKKKKPSSFSGLVVSRAEKLKMEIYN